MKTPPTRLIPILLCAVPFLANGCAGRSSPDTSLASTAGSEARKVIIAPLNVASSLPLELEGSSQVIINTLVGQLKAHGKEVELLGFQIGKQLWVEATKEVKAAGMKRNYESAVHKYALEVAERAEFDALILPTIYIQNATVRRSHAKWDGVTARIEEKGKPPRMDESSGRNLSMVAKAASIMVSVLDPAGSTIHEKRYGLELLQHVQFPKSRRSDFQFTIEDDNPPIEDMRNVRTGIANALSPFLAIEPPSTAAAPSAGRTTGEAIAQSPPTAR